MSKDEPEIIRLMDATGTVVLDSVASEYEDSFCLEAFGESIKLAESCEPKGTKHFIIARVQTWDHKQPDRAFYSYYHAHHLNKLLFQTQIYLQKKLIHRLHVLNPLTNTDIIGNVLYFMVIGRSKRNKLGLVVRESQKDQSALRAAVEVTPDEPKVEAAALAVPPSPSVSRLPPLQDPISLNRAIHNQGPETIMEEEEDEEDDDRNSPPKSPRSPKSNASDIVRTGWTLTGAVSAEGDESEQQALVNDEDKNKRKSIAMEVLGTVTRRLSITTQKSKGFVPIETNEPQDQSNHLAIDMTSKSKGFRGPGNLRVTTSLNTNNVATSGPRSAQVPKASMNSPAAINQPMSAFDRTNFQDGLMSPSRLKQTPVLAGQITQRGEKITPIQALAIVPPSARSRRRSLSYMNAVQTSGSTSATIDDWKRAYKSDKVFASSSGEQDKLDQAAGKYDEVKPIQAGESVPEEKDDYFYDAILIATDNDFLESSRIRAIFKENAVNPSDAVLFEMPPYTGEQRVHRGPNHIEDSPLPCDFCFPTDEQLRNSPLWLRFLHECKCYLLLIILTIALIVFITMAASGSQGQ